MENKIPHTPVLFRILQAFAVFAVASIALQNLIWAAVVLFLFAHYQSKKSIDWPRTLFPAATLIFLFTFLLGALVGINPSNSFHTVHKYLTFLLVFPLGAMFIELREIEKLLSFLLYGASFCALVGIGKHFFLHQDRIDSFSGDKMVFGGMLMVCFIFQVLVLKKNPINPWHWLSLLLLGTGLLLTETRGAWIGLTAGLILFAWRANKKWLLAGAFVLAALFFVLPKPIQERIQSIPDIRWKMQDGKMTNATHSRLLIWAAGVNIIRDHPLGIGQGNLGEIYPRYRMPNGDIEDNVPHLHNNFLQILAQNGWIGLAAYLFWILIYFVSALKASPREQGARELNWGFLCVFVSILFWGLTEYTFSHQFMNLQFFLLGLQLNLWRKNNPLQGA